MCAAASTSRYFTTARNVLGSRGEVGRPWKREEGSSAEAGRRPPQVRAPAPGSLGSRRDPRALSLDRARATSRLDATPPRARRALFAGEMIVGSASPLNRVHEILQRMQASALSFAPRRA